VKGPSKPIPHRRYPAFNVLQALGIPVDDLSFVRIAGAVELLFGLLIISGALPQVVIVARIPFNATLSFLGTPELIGHPPVYAAMPALRSTVPTVAWLVRSPCLFRWDGEV
jgi:hypothetical protein